MLAQVSAPGVGAHHLGNFRAWLRRSRWIHKVVDPGVTFFSDAMTISQGKNPCSVASPVSLRGSGSRLASEDPCLCGIWVRNIEKSALFPHIGLSGEGVPRTAFFFLQAELGSFPLLSIRSKKRLCPSHAPLHLMCPNDFLVAPGNSWD